MRRWGNLHASAGLPVVFVLALMAWSVPGHAQETPVEEAGPDEEGEAEEATEQASPGADVETSSSANQERLEKIEEALSAQQAQLARQQKEIEALQAENAALKEQATANEALATEALTSGAWEGQLDDDKFRIYGFADMAFTKRYIRDGAWQKNLIDDNSSFVMGNVNVYFDAKPVETFRVLSEIRFTLYPHGSAAGGGTFDLVDSTVYDATSATGRNRVIQSGIVIERAWIEWNKIDAFKIRTGYFLTPYGIWNVDHGSPTLISSVLPSFWAEEYFPTRQIGVQVLGSVFKDRMEYGYRAWVGNGRMTSQTDLDYNKHFGGRLFAHYNGSFDAQVGASGFWGRQTESVKGLDLSSPTFAVTRTEVEQYDEFGLAADISLDVEKLRLRGEYVMNRINYAEGLRPPTATGGFLPDNTRSNVYGIVAYRLPWANLEPYLYVEHAERISSQANRSTIYSGGLIEHIRPGIQFKFQAYFVHFPSDDDFPNASDSDFPGWDMRLVSVF